MLFADERNFGLIIAFVIPGWVALLGLSSQVPLFQSWLEGSLDTSPTVGGFLSALLAAIAFGTFLSTVRWLLIDPLVTFLSLPSPQPHFSQLRDAHGKFKGVRRLCLSSAILNPRGIYRKPALLRPLDNDRGMSAVQKEA